MLYEYTKVIRIFFGFFPQRGAIKLNNRFRIPTVGMCVGEVEACSRCQFIFYLRSEPGIKFGLGVDSMDVHGGEIEVWNRIWQFLFRNVRIFSDPGELTKVFFLVPVLSANFFPRFFNK